MIAKTPSKGLHVPVQAQSDGSHRHASRLQEQSEGSHVALLTASAIEEVANDKTRANKNSIARMGPSLSVWFKAVTAIGASTLAGN